MLVQVFGLTKKQMTGGARAGRRKLALVSIQHPTSNHATDIRYKYKVPLRGCGLLEIPRVAQA